MACRDRPHQIPCFVQLSGKSARGAVDRSYPRQSGGSAISAASTATRQTRQICQHNWFINSSPSCIRQLFGERRQPANCRTVGNGRSLSVVETHPVTTFFQNADIGEITVADLGMTQSFTRWKCQFTLFADGMSDKVRIKGD